MGWYVLVFCLGYLFGVAALLTLMVIGEAGKDN